MKLLKKKDQVNSVWIFAAFHKIHFLYMLLKRALPSHRMSLASHHREGKRKTKGIKKAMSLPKIGKLLKCDNHTNQHFCTTEVENLASSSTARIAQRLLCIELTCVCFNSGMDLLTPKAHTRWRIYGRSCITACFALELSRRGDAVVCITCYADLSEVC